MNRRSLTQCITGVVAALIAITTAVVEFEQDQRNNVRVEGSRFGLGASFFDSVHMSIDYPERVRLGESQLVVVEMSQEDGTPNPLPIGRRPSNPPVKNKKEAKVWEESEAILHLHGAGFVVTPSVPVARNVAHSRLVGTSTIWKWTIAARQGSLGAQTLVLSINGVDWGRFMNESEYSGMRIEFAFTRNGTDVEWTGNNIQDLEIPIFVLTQFGVSQPWVWATQAILSVVSFVLLYPVVTSIIGSRVRRTSNKD